jgi:predicted nucleic acid-binding protein
MEAAVFDASSLINVYSSLCAEAILRAVFDTILIPREVEAESFFIRQPSPDDPAQLIHVPLDLAPLSRSGILTVVSLAQQSELNLFIRLVAILDDGEAASLALAASRGLPLVTDDRKAANIAGDLDVRVITTPEVLKHWVDAASPAQDEVITVVTNIERWGC